MLIFRRQLRSSSTLNLLSTLQWTRKHHLDLSGFPEKFEEVYQEDKYVIVNKAPGLDCQDRYKSKRVSRGEKDLKGLFSLLKSLDPEMRNVHRLDKWVSGGVLITRDKTTSQRFSRQLQKGGQYGYGFKRRYVAIFENGSFPNANENLQYIDAENNAGTITTHDEKGESVTKFIRYHMDGQHQLAIIQLETGRKHQIRRHLSEVIGKPILNDFKYGFAGGLPEKAKTIGLHSAFIQTRVGLKIRDFQIPIKFDHNGIWSKFIDNEGFFIAEVQDILSNFENKYFPQD